MHRFRTLLALSTGASAAYFLDPTFGKRRRARAKDQITAWTKRRRRQHERAARYEAGVHAGEAARARGAGRYHPHSDTDLHEHLRMVLANLDVPTSAVNVEVVEGLVRLRGQVADGGQAAAVLTAVASVPGVSRVEDLLHLPGRPAPNKAAALAASATASATSTSTSGNGSSTVGQWATGPGAPGSPGATGV
jgi:hypothetical protein